jgi:hypothetical protein
MTLLIPAELRVAAAQIGPNAHASFRLGKLGLWVLSRVCA